MIDILILLTWKKPEKMRWFLIHFQFILYMVWEHVLNSFFYTELSSVPSTAYQTVSFFLGIFLALLPLIRLNHLAWSRSVHGCLGKDHISCKEIHFSSVTQSCTTLCDPMTAACQASLSITNCRSLPKPITIELVMTSNHLILCRPLLLLPLIFPSIRDFSNESALWIRRPKYWSFSFNISPSNEHPGLISFRMDGLDLLAVQGTLKNLLQHHSSKASILRHSAFFIVQLSHPYVTTGKTIALTRRTFVDKVMSLLLNMLSRLLITFLPRNQHFLISWLQSLSWMILEPRKIQSATVSTVSPSICHQVMGPDAMILVFWMLSCKATFSLSTFTFIKRFWVPLHFLP